MIVVKKFRKKIVIYIFFLAFAIIISACQKNNANYRADILNNFLDRAMTSPEGAVYTNYLNTNSVENLAKGHQILSESIGLQLLIYNEKKDKAAFEKLMKYCKLNFKMENEIYRWRILENSEEPLTNSTATIDDLRLAEAMIEHDKLYNTDLYYGDIYNISYGLLNNCLENQYLLHSNESDGLVEISYLKFQTMDNLSDMDKNWDKIYLNSIQVTENAFIDIEYPFYKKTYDLNKSTFIENEEINMIDALLVVLNLSEINKVRPETIKWLENELSKGKIYSAYNINTKEVSNENESPAIYAITYLIGENIKNESIKNYALKRLLDMQIIDKESEFYGSFANEENKEVYSFDLLLALLVFEKNKK